MTEDTGEKFEPTRMRLDELSAALDDILADLEGLLDDDPNCDVCGMNQTSCPDCEQDEAHVEAEEEV